MGQGGAIASWLPVCCSTAPRFLLYLKKGVRGIFAHLQLHSSMGVTSSGLSYAAQCITFPANGCDFFPKAHC